MRMRRGIIILGGPAKDLTGLQMKGGTIILMNGAEIRTGAWMNRGTIISLKPLQLMPTFVCSGNTNLIVMTVLANYVKQFGITLPHAVADGTYCQYSGDSTIGRTAAVVQSARGHQGRHGSRAFLGDRETAN